jgi:hypothetical protein
LREGGLLHPASLGQLVAIATSGEVGAQSAAFRKPTDLPHCLGRRPGFGGVDLPIARVVGMSAGIRGEDKIATTASALAIDILDMLALSVDLIGPGEEVSLRVGNRHRRHDEMLNRRPDGYPAARAATKRRRPSIVSPV